MTYIQTNNPFKLKTDPPSGGRKSYTLNKKQQDKVFPGLKEKKSSNEPRKTIGPGKNFNKVAKDKSATGGAAGGGMTEKGVKAYRRKAAKRRKSFCARSRGWTGERGKAARRRWNC